jgi:hypothetical protein
MSAEGGIAGRAPKSEIRNPKEGETNPKLEARNEKEVPNAKMASVASWRLCVKCGRDGGSEEWSKFNIFDMWAN